MDPLSLDALSELFKTVLFLWRSQRPNCTKSWLCFVEAGGNALISPTMGLLPVRTDVKGLPAGMATAVTKDIAAIGSLL